MRWVCVKCVLGCGYREVLKYGGCNQCDGAGGAQADGGEVILHAGARMGGWVLSKSSWRAEHSWVDRLALGAR